MHPHLVGDHGGIGPLADAQLQGQALERDLGLGAPQALRGLGNGGLDAQGQEGEMGPAGLRSGFQRADRSCPLKRLRFTWSVVILRGCAATQAGRLWSGVQSILHDRREVKLL